MIDLLQRYWLPLALLVGLINLLGISVDIAEPDAALYAEIAREIYASGNWLALTFHGEAFLDKPHLPFWLAAASYHLFEVTSLAYRLPALLFVLLGVIYTWLLADRLYNRRVAISATLMLLVTGHFVISNTDVRAEGYLLGMTVFAFYYLIRFLDSRSWLHLFGACVGAACLLMTKGLFTLLPLFFGVVGGLIINRDWHKLYHWQWLSRWLVGAIVTLILASPVMIAYAIQFDLQPDLLVDMREWGEMSGVSGVRFFWWDSQFGRFFNNGPIQGHGEILFYLHTILWALFPWAVLWYLATFSKVKSLITGMRSEVWCLCAVVPTLVIFSLSKFQLPHYLNPLFPFFLIPLAGWLHQSSDQLLTRLGLVQLPLLLLALLLPGLFWLFAKPIVWSSLLVWVTAIIALILVYLRCSALDKVLLAGLIVTASVNLFAVGELLPWLTRYQAGSQLAHYINHTNKHDERLLVYGVKTEALDFYLNKLVPRVDNIEQIKQTLPTLVFTKQAGFDQLLSSELKIEPIAEFNDFAITRFNPYFFDRTKRHTTLRLAYLVRVSNDIN